MALLGAPVLENWHVSIAAIVITGSIILFCQALQLIMQPLAAAPSPTPQALLSLRRPGDCHISLGHSCPGHCSRHCGHCRVHGYCACNWAQKGIVLAALLVIMGLNLVTLLNIEKISKAWTLTIF